MLGTKRFGIAVVVVLASMLGCKGVRPILPRKPLPPDTIQMHFIRKISGPLDITIDGVRIPVEQKKKKAQLLTIRGLSQGKHYYFISSPHDLIGPDLGDFEIGPDEGIFQIHFANRLKVALVEAGAPAPEAEGIAGVTAVLE
jgi:hypothetical protein